MSSPSAFPLLWLDNGKTLNFRAINNIPNLEDRVDEVLEDIRANTSVQKIFYSRKLSSIGDKINKNKLYEAFLNPRIKEIEVCWSADSMLLHWLSRALREINIEKLGLRLELWDLTDDLDVSKFRQALGVNTSLKEFHLSCYHKKSSRSRDIAESLPLRFQSYLTSLHLNRLTPNSVIPVCGPILNALGTNMTVKDLRLVFHCAKQQNLEFVRDRASLMLQANTTLEDLTIRSLGARRYPDVGPVLHSLNGNTSLKSLHLQGFHIRARNYTLVNDTVVKLELRDCVMDMQGARSIGGTLSHLTALKSLDFSFCQVDNAKIVPICKVLEDSGSLEHLKLGSVLGSNNIGDDGCAHICEALDGNNVLTTLGLSSTRITDTGANALIECVKTHPALTSINGIKTSVSDAVMDELEYYLDLNEGPKRLLNARVPLPPSLLPKAFTRADKCRHVTDNLGFPFLKAPDVLYFLVKELFAGAH